MIQTLLILFVMSIYEVPNEGYHSIRKPAGCDFFGKENAVKILGGNLTPTGNDWTEKDGDRWNCVFTNADNDSGPKIYFLMIRNFTEETAVKEFDAIRKSNKSHEGFEEWSGVGDEAIVHTDGDNFQFVMVRKGARTIRIKVNPSVGVSFDNVKSVAESLVERLQPVKPKGE